MPVPPVTATGRPTDARRGPELRYVGPGHPKSGKEKKEDYPAREDVRSSARGQKAFLNYNHNRETASEQA